MLHIPYNTWHIRPTVRKHSPTHNEINNRIIPELNMNMNDSINRIPEDHLCLPATTTNFATSSCASGEAEVVLVAGVMWHVAHAALRSSAWPARSHEYRKCAAH